MTTMILGVGPGFGAALAHAFGATGQTVILVARHAPFLATLTAELQQQGVSARYQVADVSNAAQLAQVFAAEPNVETLIYNVGDTHLDSPLTTTPAQMAATFQTNVLGCVAACQAFSQTAAAHTILVTGGGAALHPSAFTTTLAVTKAALRSYVLALHQALAPRNIYVGLMTIQGIAKLGAAMAPERVAAAYVQAAQQRTAPEIFYPYGTPNAPSEFEQLKQDPAALARLLAAYPELKNTLPKDSL